MLGDPLQQTSAIDMGRRESFSSVSALRSALWKSLQDMFAYPEKSEGEIAGTIRGSVAEQYELEQMLTVLRISPLLTRARRAHERWVGLPFTLYYEGRLWSGTIDLAFIADDAWSIGYVLLDPSSIDQVRVTSDASTTPLFLHAFALERLTERLVQDVTLVDGRSGEMMPFPWGATERHSLALELARPSTVGGAVQ